MRSETKKRYRILQETINLLLETVTSNQPNPIFLLWGGQPVTRARWQLIRGSREGHICPYWTRARRLASTLSLIRPLLFRRSEQAVAVRIKLWIKTTWRNTLTAAISFSMTSIERTVSCQAQAFLTPRGSRVWSIRTRLALRGKFPFLAWKTWTALQGNCSIVRGLSILKILKSHRTTFRTESISNWLTLSSGTTSASLTA